MACGTLGRQAAGSARLLAPWPQASLPRKGWAATTSPSMHRKGSNRSSLGRRAQAQEHGSSHHGDGGPAETQRGRWQKSFLSRVTE